MTEKKKGSKERYLKLNPKAAGISLGIIFAVSLIILSFWVMILGIGQEIIDMLAYFYLGYDSTLLGLVIGGIYGFIDGFLIGVAYAWIYNKFL